MAFKANPIYQARVRELGIVNSFKSDFFDHRIKSAKNLYHRDLVCHFGCVNAIEFSDNGELLVSGGDDRRVMFWNFGHTLMHVGQPEAMKGLHQSNIFCLGITSDNQKVCSGGNDNIVIVHDTETKRPLEVLQHQKAVCGLSIDPFNERIVSTAGNDGRLLLFDTRQSVHETLVISRSKKAFHGVMYHPRQTGLLVSANARDGVALWDLRSPKLPAVHYLGNNGVSQSSMSVRFNAEGTQVLALRRRMSPVLYCIQSPDPVVEFYHQDYYNSCTMKSCCFAGEGHRFVMSGSDDFNLYAWQVPELSDKPLAEPMTVSPHLVLYGHRSIVNQVRYNEEQCLIASSGVEKIIKIWSPIEFPKMRGDTSKVSNRSDNPREMYSHEDYVTLVHHSGQDMSSHYMDQSTSEDQRMLAFFDSIIQRELECLAGETDSLDSSSPPPVPSASSDSDSDQILADILPLAKRTAFSNMRATRDAKRTARLVASRHQKKPRTQKRGVLRRTKQARPRKVVRSTGLLALARPQLQQLRRSARISAPSSERTDEDEPRLRKAAIKSHRRRANTVRLHKRKETYARYRKNTWPNGEVSRKRVSESFDTANNDPAVPSTSTGFRGHNSGLFRIQEVDSDDDHSASSPSTSRNELNMTSSAVVEETRRPHARRPRRNGRHQQRSDSSDSPPHRELNGPSTSLERLSPQFYNRTVARLMNETNESEMESSCSTESGLWPEIFRTPDSGVGTAAGSSTRNNRIDDDGSDDAEYYAASFRQRVKRARRNYRVHIDSDSN